MFKHQDLQMFGFKIKNKYVTHFEVVGRALETKIQVGEN